MYCPRQRRLHRLGGSSAFLISTSSPPLDVINLLSTNRKEAVSMVVWVHLGTSGSIPGNGVLRLRAWCGIIRVPDERLGPPLGWARFAPCDRSPGVVLAHEGDLALSAARQEVGSGRRRGSSRPGGGAAESSISGFLGPARTVEGERRPSKMCLQRSPSCVKIVLSVEVVTDVINRGQDYLERR